MLNDRLRRITDLFVEGTEVYFGNDSQNRPVVSWVNKLNSFEMEEARRDGQTARGIRVAAMTGDDSAELKATMATISSWSDERLAEMRVEQMTEELYLEVLNDIEADPEMKDAVDLVRRGSEILDDDSAGEADPRREQLSKAQAKYLEAIRVGQEKAQRHALDEVRQNSRETNVEDFLEAWRTRATIDLFMEERRITEIFYSLRECVATIVGTGNDGKPLFDHTHCNHAQRSLESRKDVRQLPERVLERIIDAIDDISVNPREAGNSAAPGNSSASSEQPSAEAASVPSIPVETPSAAPTT